MSSTIFGFCIGLFRNEQDILQEHEVVKTSIEYKVCIFYNNKNTDYYEFLGQVKSLEPVKLSEYKPYMVSRESTFDSLVESFCKSELK